MRQPVVATIILAIAASAAAGAVRIELQPSAAVSAPIVRLGDVALIEGDDSGLLRGQSLCPAPVAGETLTLSQARLRRRVMALVGEADFSVAGADACLLTRQAAPAQPAATVSTGAAKAGASAPAATGVALDSLVRDYVAAELHRPADRFRVEFEQRDVADLAVTDATSIFRFTPAGGDLSPGPAAVRVEAYDRADAAVLDRTFYVRFRIILIEDVVVANRDIRAGEVIAEADVAVQRREFTTDPTPCLRDIGDVVGSTARTNIPATTPLVGSSLTRTLMVRRGDPVTVHIVGRGFTMKTISRALESGESGSVVAVQGKDGKGKFYAMVTGPRTVELRLAGAAQIDQAGADSRG